MPEADRAPAWLRRGMQRVAAYLRRLALADIPAYVTRRGDDTAGAVMVKCATLDGAPACGPANGTLNRPAAVDRPERAAERDIDAEIARPPATPICG